MITFVLIIAAIAFVIAVIITKLEIPFLRKKAGQNIREEGLKSHYSKAGTPSMGGISIIIGTCVAALGGGVFGYQAVGYSLAGILIILLVFVGFGFVGFLDAENRRERIGPETAVSVYGRSKFCAERAAIRCILCDGVKDVFKKHLFHVLFKCLSA